MYQACIYFVVLGGWILGFNTLFIFGFFRIKKGIASILFIIWYIERDRLWSCWLLGNQLQVVELSEPFDAYAGQMFFVAFFASFWGLCKSSQHLADVRAGLSTWQYSCKCLVSMGAGLPTQRTS